MTALDRCDLIAAETMPCTALMGIDHVVPCGSEAGRQATDTERRISPER
jgi:hypothetical protein